jgi:uncharacterized protein YdhG (YjbR/CyaY superfamily)
MEPYKSGKSTIQFQLDKPLPKKHIEEIIKYSIIDNKDRMKKNKSGK